MRFIHHSAVGLIVFFYWLLLAADSGLCTGPANTTEFWFGLSLVILVLASRVACYVQKELKGERPDLEVQFHRWAQLCGPYLMELPFYGLVVLILGDTYTLGIRNCVAGWELRSLALFSLPLALLCAGALGWKLSTSRLPAWLPVLAAGTLCVASVPLLFQLNESLMPQTYPLLPVSAVVLAGLLFLLFCCRSGAWFTTCPRPHPALVLACLLPMAPFPLLLTTLAIADPKAFMVVTLIGLTMTLFTVSPLYLGIWVWLPGAKCRSALFAWSLILGMASAYGQVYLGSVFIEVERAPLCLGWSPLYLLGLLGVFAPLCVKRKT